MSYYLPETDSVFIHIPKTAGSSVSNWIKENLNYKVLGKQHDLYRHWCKNHGKPTYHFVVVRNPYARIFSWFHYQGRLITDKIDAGEKLTSTEEQNLEFHNKGFDHWVLNSERPWYYKDIKRQQIEYFNKDTVIKVHLENINEEFVQIQEHVNCFAPIGKDNVSTSSQLDYRDFYSKKSKQFVEKIYGGDFSYLGYKF